MIVDLKLTYGPTIADGAGNPSAQYSGYGFDTETLTIVPVSGTWRGAQLDNKPADLNLAEGFPFWFDCAGATEANDFEAVAYYHVRATQSFRTAAYPKCEFCGYVAPTCDLTQPVATLTATTVTITVSGNRGTLSYQLDALAAQVGNVFENLAPGPHVVKVTDAGVADCTRTVSFTVPEPGAEADPPFPATPPESLSLVYRPVWEIVTGYAAGKLLLLELWMETAHQVGDYQLVYQAEKVVGEDGEVGFRLDTPLLDQLEHLAPDLQVQEPYLVTRPLANYFTRVRVVNPATGVAGTAVNRAVHTALLAGLAVPGQFLTTQPATKKVALYEPEFLYYLNPYTGPATVQVRRVLRFSTGQPTETTEPIVLGATAGKARYRLLCIPVFNGPQPDNLVQVQVSVTSAQGQVLAQARTYTLVPAVGRRRAFLFDNPAGGIDTLVATGTGSGTLDVKPEIVERATSWRSTPRQATRQVLGVPMERRQQVATGWLSAPQLRWLQALLLTRATWLSTGAGLVPIVLNKRSLTHQRDAQQLQGFTLEYELGNEELDWEDLRP